MLHLVAYDIADDARRLRVAKALLDYGVRVQESVFECLVANEAKVAEMIDRLRELIEPEEDAVRIVPVCAACTGKLVILGRGEPTKDPDVYVV